MSSKPAGKRNLGTIKVKRKRKPPVVHRASIQNAIAPIQPQKLFIIFCTIAVSIVFLHCLTLFVLPHMLFIPWIFNRTWGIHFIKYYPTAIQVLFYALAVCVCIPYINIRCFRLFKNTIEIVHKHIPVSRKEVYFIGISIVSVVLFSMFNMKYAFLGDGLLRLDNVVKNKILLNESGTIFIMHLFYSAAHNVFSLNDSALLKLFSNMCGGLFIYTTLHIADLLGKSVFEKIAFFIMYVLFGTLQHFCGYVEVYALSVLLITVYLYTSILCLRGKIHWVVVLFVFILSLWCHLVTLFIVPSLVYVLYTVKFNRYPFLRNIWVLISGACILLFGAYPLIIKYIIPELYPITSADPAELTLFSPIHFYEYANGIVLGTGFLLIVTIACLVYAFQHHIRLNHEIWFLMVTSASFLCCLFLLRAMLGSSDWDTFSYAAISINLLGIYLLFYLFSDSNYRPFLRYAVVIITILMALETFAWIGINAGSKSIKRFEDIIMTDPEYYYLQHPGPMVLGVTFDSNNLQSESIKYFRLAYEMYPDDVRCGYNYASHLLLNNDMVLGFLILDKLFNKNPTYTLTYRLLFDVAMNMNEQTYALSVLQRMFQMYAINPELYTSFYTKSDLVLYFILLANNYLVNNDLLQAEKVFATIMDLEPLNKVVMMKYALVLFAENKFDYAVQVCDNMLKSTQIPSWVLHNNTNNTVQHNNAVSTKSALRMGILALKDNDKKHELMEKLNWLTHDGMKK